MWWEGPYYHPKEFGAQEVTADLIQQLRGAVDEPGSAAPVCNAAAALKSGAALWPTAPAVAARCAAAMRRLGHGLASAWLTHPLKLLRINTQAMPSRQFPEG